MPPELDFSAMGSDIVMDGILRKAKNWNKRYFVLRNSYPAKLEYYDSERKWKSNGKPKRTISLERPWNIAKKKDAKHHYLIVIFTEEECFSVAADNAEEQEKWMKALQKITSQEPGCLFYKHMWLVNLDNKEIEGCSSAMMSSLHGSHLVCLTNDQIILVQANCNGGADRSKGQPLEIPITSIRGIAHSKEGKFYIEPGRASGIGSGRLWMELGDEVMAAAMHQTILRLMYDLKEEEAYYRDRSYSSGSNSGRVRSVRSHHNNPPPSLIGMGKLPATHSFNKRMRCDSMPAAHISGLSNSRFRTGSEGEHTLRRSPRNNSLRCRNGPSSPGMRNRLLKPLGRRNSFLHHHHHHHTSHVIHNHISSVTCSCNTSSTESSSEHLNNIVGYPDFTSLMAYDSAAFEEFSNVHSPLQNGLRSIQRIKTINRPPSHFQDNWNPTVRESQHCSCCSVRNSQLSSYDDISRIPIRHEMAPPPPEIDPPHFPFNHSSSSNAVHEYVNYSPPSRTNSVEESENCSTPASSLSSSPRQASSILQASEPNNEDFHSSGEPCSEKDCEEQALSTPPAPSSPKSQSPLPTDEVTHPDEYTAMNYDGSFYPHQLKPILQPKNTFLSKVASFAGLSSHSRSSSATDDAEYTPMAATYDLKLTSPSSIVEGYVPMRSFVRSVPQDIGSRRKSMPDTGYRYSRTHRSSPPLPDDLASCQHFCQDCCDRPRRHQVFQPSVNYGTNSKSSRDCSNLHQDDLKKSIGVNSGHLAPPISDSPRLSTASPTSKANEESLNMQLLHQEIREVEKTLSNSKHDSADLSLSSSSIHDSTNEDGRYLPMNSIKPNLNGHVKSSLAENHNHVTTGALYPHQRKDRTFITNSLERPKQWRNKRTKSLSSLRLGSSYARRSHSVKDRQTNNNAVEPGSSSILAPSQTSRSPGGDYVNIDFRKAQKHFNCPHVVNVAAP